MERTARRWVGGWGLAAMGVAGAALVTMAITLLGGPFAPAQPTGQALGGFLVELARGALTEAAGAPAEVEARIWNIDRVLQVAVGAGGALAIALAAVGWVQHEPRRPLAAAAAMGAVAMVFPFAVGLVAAVLLLVLVGLVLGAIGGG